MKKPASINGGFSAKNPQTGEMKYFNMNEMGWLSRTGCFHFGKKVPTYAKEGAIKYYLKHMPMITNWVF